MAKRGVFDQFLKPRLSSSAGSFEKRGDKWVTNREGIRDYARNLDTENAERDWWLAINGDKTHTRARVADERVIHRNEKPVGIDATRRQSEIRRVNIALGLKQDIRKMEPRDNPGKKIEPMSTDLRLHEMNQNLTHQHRKMTVHGATGNLAKRIRKPILSIKGRK